MVNVMKHNKTIELLAPAGSWEALEAAVNAGADAVYMGGKAFGARQYASNFDREELTRAVYFAHMHRVRLYITVNTLVDDAEMPELADYLLFLNNVGAAAAAACQHADDGNKPCRSAPVCGKRHGTCRAGA